MWPYCRSLLIHYGEHLGLDSKKVPGNSSVSQFAEAMAKAWTEYNNPRLDLSQRFWFFSAAAFPEVN